MEWNGKSCWLDEMSEGSEGVWKEREPGEPREPGGGLEIGGKRRLSMRLDYPIG